MDRGKRPPPGTNGEDDARKGAGRETSAAKPPKPKKAKSNKGSTTAKAAKPKKRPAPKAVRAGDSAPPPAVLGSVPRADEATIEAGDLAPDPVVERQTPDRPDQRRAIASAPPPTPRSPETAQAAAEPRSPTKPASVFPRPPAIPALRSSYLPPPLAAPTVRRRQGSRAPLIEERLTVRSKLRQHVPDDDIPRSRRPRLATQRPPSPETNVPPTANSAVAAMDVPSWSGAEPSSALGEWPFDRDERLDTSSALHSIAGGDDFAGGVASVLAKLRPDSEGFEDEKPSTPGALESEAPVPSGRDPWATPRRRSEAPSGRAADANPTNDDDVFNPFLERLQRNEESERAFSSFLDQPEESVPSGLQAMFGSRPLPGSQRDMAFEESGSAGLSETALSSEAPHASRAPLLSDAPSSSDRVLESEAPVEDRFSEAPASRLSLPGGPSLDALDEALGHILGSKFPAAVAGGSAAMENQLHALLEQSADARASDAEVDYGGLDGDFLPGSRGATAKGPRSSQRGAAEAGSVPDPTETLRGVEAREGFFDDSDDDADDVVASEPPPPSSWGDEPVRITDRTKSSLPTDDVLDLDSSDVQSIPPPQPQRWAENDDDDFSEQPVRVRSSNVPRSSVPPTSDPADDEADDVDEDDDDLDDDSDERASEWGTTKGKQAGTIAKSIANYDDSLEKVSQVAGMFSGRKAKALSSRPPRRSKRPPSAIGRGIGLATALVVGAVSVTLLPWYLLTRAEKHAQSCFRELVRTAEGDPDLCVPSTGELALARNLPWLKDDAKRVKDSSDFRAARLAYDKATAIVPNAAKRDEATARLLDLTYHGTANERTAALGVVAGAHDAVTQFALAHRDPEAVSFALRSARATADLDSMRSLATGSTEEDPFGMSLRRGALLCLLGDPEEGARAFVAADLAQQRLDTSLDGQGLARLGLIACGKPKGVEGEIDARRLQDRYRPALAALEASLDTQEGFDQARAFLENGKVKVGGIQRLRIAPYVIRETTPSALEALRLMAPLHEPAARFDANAVRTPWMLSDVEAPVQAVYVDTRAAEVAAPYLEKLAEKVSGKPLDCSGEECPDPAALKLPDAVLKEAARMVWFEAATEHARLGHREAAIEAANRATELATRNRRYLAAPVFLAVGDAEGALALLTEASEHIDGYTPVAQTRIHLNHTLALAHLGRFEQALESAERAFRAASRAEDAARENSDGIDTEVALQDDKVATAWLWGAMALLVGKPDAVSEALRDASSKELAEVATWVGLATRPEEERRAERWELSIATPSQPALPAVMYVVSRAVPSMTDVEVWLDRVFQQEHRTQPVRSMLARAEVARWRNAPDAERTWQGRSAKMLGLIKDYKTSLLAHILELH